MKLTKLFVIAMQFKRRILGNRRARYILLGTFLALLVGALILRQLGLISNSTLKKIVIPGKCGVCPNLTYCGGCKMCGACF